MTWFKHQLQTPAGRLLVWSSIISFILSLVIGPGPVEAMSDSLHDTVKAMRGTDRRLSTAEMKAIQGAATAGAPDPWDASDKNAGGYGTASINNGNGNEMLSFPLVSYASRGLPVGFGLTWNSASVPSFGSPYALSAPCGIGFTHSYNLYVSVDPSTGNVTVHEGDGRLRLYTHTGSSYVPPVGIHDNLVKNVDGSYTLTRKNQVQIHYSASISDYLGLHADTITDTHGNQITIAYQTFTVPDPPSSHFSAKQAVTITDAVGRVLTLAYNSTGLLSTVTDPDSRVWTIGYNSTGDVTSITFPRVISGVHTSINLAYTGYFVHTLQDRRGNTWTLTISSSASITSSTDPYGHAHSYNYSSSFGSQTTILTDENGNLSRLTEDSNHRFNGQMVQFYTGYTTVGATVWDSSNNMSSRTDGNSNTCNYTYDSNGNKLSEQAPSVGGVTPTTSWTYNSHNDCTSIETPLGYMTYMTYNSDDDLTGVTDSLSHTITYTVNSYGQVTGIEDPNSHSETMTYDPDTGQVASVTDADSNTASYTWDDLSRMTERIDARSNETDYSFDADSNLTQITYPDTSVITVGFDANDNKTGMTDSHGNWSWTFDEDNRLTGTTDPSSRTVGYTLDYGGRATLLTRQDGTTVGYGYDGGNRVTSVTDSAISSTATTMSYDGDSNIAGMTLSNGATVTKGYDAMERLTSVVNKTSGGTDISSYSYNYDDDSDRTDVTELDGSEVAYSYDDLHRLTSEVRTGTSPYNYSYTLDPAGNRTAWTDNTHQTSVSYTYDDANRLTAAGNYSYGYDNDGNRTSVTLGGNTTTYYFDYEDRLDAIGTSVSYNYIGAGTDRFSKTVSGTTTQFLYDSGGLDEEMRGSTVTADFGAAAENLSGTVSWMLQDGQGSTRQLLNSSQTVVASYTSDAFGNSVSSSGSSSNPFIWNGGSGYYSDAESGLQKVGARYYDPAVGRWISQDTLLVAGSVADSQALNRYDYTRSSPTDGTDPTGMAERTFWYTIGRMTANFIHGRDLYHGMYDEEEVGVREVVQEIKVLEVEVFDRTPPSGTPATGVWRSPGPPPDQGGPGGPPSGATGGDDGPGLGGPDIANPCFVAGTKVLMADGRFRRIEKLCIGDYVMSRDPANGTVASKRVYGTKIQETAELLELQFERGEIVKTTPEHRFFIIGKGFLPAAQMQAGMKCMTRSGSTLGLVGVKDISVVRLKVYNLLIADFHTFFVGTLSIWVHNNYVDVEPGAPIGDPLDD